MDPHTSAELRNDRRLTFTATHFSDYWAALSVRIRRDNFADLVFAGALKHPLLHFQAQYAAQFIHHGIPVLSSEQLNEDPLGYYQQLSNRINDLNLADGDEQGFDMTELAASFVAYRQGQRYIYTRVVETLSVGTSMHYARGVPFGAGTRLMASIFQDNNRQTTMSLLAVFRALMTLTLTPPETLDQFFRRHEHLINRLLSWNPPIILPDPLHVACLLQGIPETPFGPVKHIISSATPVHTLRTTRTMLRDVAQTSAVHIATNHGRQPAHVLTAQVIPDAAATAPANDAVALLTRLLSQQPGGGKTSPGSDLFRIHGPCKHHGPKCKHATLECRNPTLSKRKKKKDPTTTSMADGNFADLFVVNTMSSASDPALLFEAPPTVELYFGDKMFSMSRSGRTVANLVSLVASTNDLADPELRVYFQTGKTEDLPWRESTPIWTAVPHATPLDAPCALQAQDIRMEIFPVPDYNHPQHGQHDKRSRFGLHFNLCR
jgi:hypothetical protein